GFLHGQIGRSFALEDAARIDAGLTIGVRSTSAIAYQAAGRGEVAVLVDRRNRVAQGQGREFSGPAIEVCIGADHQSGGAQLQQGREDAVKVAVGAGTQDFDLQPHGGRRRVEFACQVLVAGGIGGVWGGGNDRGRRGRV